MECYTLKRLMLKRFERCSQSETFLIDLNDLNDLKRFANNKNVKISARESLFSFKSHLCSFLLYPCHATSDIDGFHKFTLSSSQYCYFLNQSSSISFQQIILLFILTVLILTQLSLLNSFILRVFSYKHFRRYLLFIIFIYRILTCLIVSFCKEQLVLVLTINQRTRL